MARAAKAALRSTRTVWVGGVIDVDSSSRFARLALSLTCTRLVPTAGAAKTGVPVRGILAGNALGATGSTDLSDVPGGTVSAHRGSRISTVRTSGAIGTPLVPFPGEFARRADSTAGTSLFDRTIRAVASCGAVGFGSRASLRVTTIVGYITLALTLDRLVASGRALLARSSSS